MSMEYDDDRLDEKLRAHFAAELDGQLGRAERAFGDELQLARPRSTGRTRTLRSHAWIIGAMGTAVAASMAAMWVVPVTPPAGTSVAVTQPGADHVHVMTTPGEAVPDVSPQWQQVEQVVNSMTLDDGLVLLEDNTPARLVRQVALEQVEWVDARSGARVQAVLPREGARLVPIDTY